MSSTQLNEYLVSAGAYQPRHRPPGPRAKGRRNRRWLQRNAIRTQD
jgi:hypothetical protein